ncbi:MAG: hypothetical protein GDA36_12290 [Rhodobacteraceae bacterium]|nr:hypothetical protein [Paracoccaceae bacterium]
MLPRGEGLPEPQDIHRLRHSLRDAIARITAWADTHGIENLDMPTEESTARQGWPDAGGNRWTPPWDILGIRAASDYWG